MRDRLFRLWCAWDAWDYGQDTVLFTSEEQGRKWLEQQMRSIDGNNDFEESYPGGIEQVFAEGLASVEIMSICED